MGGQRTRKDYLLAAQSGVETGAENSLLTTRAPEVRILEQQQQANALLARHFGSQEQMGRTLDSINNASTASLAAHRTQVDIARTVSTHVQDLSSSVNAGFGQIADNMGRMADKLGHDLQEMSSGIAGGLEQGFGLVDERLSIEARQSRAHQSQLTEWLGAQFSWGMEHVRDGLRVVDATLVMGFEANLRTTNLQTAVLDHRLVELGTSLTKALSIQHELDRNVLARIGRLTVSAIEREGSLTRTAILLAARAAIEVIEEEGALLRDEIRRATDILSTSIGALRTALASVLARHADLMNRHLGQIRDRIERKAEMEAREHTRVALAFMHDGLHEPARAALEKANECFSGYFPALYLRGILAILQTDLGQAQTFFQMARAQAATVDTHVAGGARCLALLMLGRIAVVRRDWAAADTLFGQAEEADPSNLMAAIEHSNAIYRNPLRGDESRRTDIVTRGLDSVPAGSRARGWYGLALLLAEDASDDAVGALRRGLKLEQRTASATPSRVQMFHTLSNLYPALVPLLYAAVFRHAPDLAQRIVAPFGPH